MPHQDRMVETQMTDIRTCAFVSLGAVLWCFASAAADLTQEDAIAIARKLLKSAGLDSKANLVETSIREQGRLVRISGNSVPAERREDYDANGKCYHCVFDQRKEDSQRVPLLHRLWRNVASRFPNG